MRYKISFDGIIAIVEFIESPDLNDLKNILDSIIDEPEFIPGMRLLLVDTGTNFNASSTVLMASASVFKNVMGNFHNRIAMVVNNDLHYGIARMISAFCAPFDIEYAPFKDFYEARKWLLE